MFDIPHMRGGEPFGYSTKVETESISPTCVGVNRSLNKSGYFSGYISPTCVGVNRPYANY